MKIRPSNPQPPSPRETRITPSGTKPLPAAPLGPAPEDHTPDAARLLGTITRAPGFVGWDQNFPIPMFLGRKRAAFLFPMSLQNGANCIAVGFDRVPGSKIQIEVSQMVMGNPRLLNVGDRSVAEARKVLRAWVQKE